MTSRAFVDAIKNARIIMDYGNQLGFSMDLLDIGGGFPGNSGTEEYFAEIAQAINKALDEHFPEDGRIRIIAEPGRYYVASAYTLATNIIAVREMIDPGLFISIGKSNDPWFWLNRNEPDEIHVLHQWWCLWFV